MTPLWVMRHRFNQCRIISISSKISLCSCIQYICMYMFFIFKAVCTNISVYSLLQILKYTFKQYALGHYFPSLTGSGVWSSKSRGMKRRHNKEIRREDCCLLFLLKCKYLTLLNAIWDISVSLTLPWNAAKPVQQLQLLLLLVYAGYTIPLTCLTQYQRHSHSWERLQMYWNLFLHCNKFIFIMQLLAAQISTNWSPGVKISLMAW